MDDITNNIKIDEYYSRIDKNILTNLCKNENLKNLIHLSTYTDIYVFNKKNKNYQLKTKDKLLKECEQIKRKEIKTSSSMLSNLAKLNDTHNSDSIKKLCNNLQSRITNIDNFVDCLNKIDAKENNIILDVLSDSSSDNFIEYYSNC